MKTPRSVPLFQVCKEQGNVTSVCVCVCVCVFRKMNVIWLMPEGEESKINVLYHQERGTLGKYLLMLVAH